MRLTAAGSPSPPMRGRDAIDFASEASEALPKLLDYVPELVLREIGLHIVHEGGANDDVRFVAWSAVNEGDVPGTC